MPAVLAHLKRQRSSRDSRARSRSPTPSCSSSTATSSPGRGREPDHVAERRHGSRRSSSSRARTARRPPRPTRSSTSRHPRRARHPGERGRRHRLLLRVGPGPDGLFWREERVNCALEQSWSSRSATSRWPQKYTVSLRIAAYILAIAASRRRTGCAASSPELGVVRDDHAEDLRRRVRRPRSLAHTAGREPVRDDDGELRRRRRAARARAGPVRDPAAARPRDPRLAADAGSTTARSTCSTASACSTTPGRAPTSGRCACRPGSRSTSSARSRAG